MAKTEQLDALYIGEYRQLPATGDTVHPYYAEMTSSPMYAGTLVLQAVQELYA